MDSDQNKKQVSPIARFALYWTLCGIILLFMGFVFGRVGEILVMAGFFVSFIAFWLGVFALIMIRHKKQKRISYVIALCAILLASLPFLWTIFLISRSLRAKKQKIACCSNIRKICVALYNYSNDYNDKLPTADAWCDLLVDYLERPDEVFKCPLSEQGSCTYALNRNIINSNYSSIPSNIILLFEAKPGWNQVGTAELWSNTTHYNYNTIGFSDGRVECVYKKSLDTLRWEPYSHGLVGAWFGESDLTNCKDEDLITSLDLSWSEGDDYGKEWSAKWQGNITAPAPGEITFHGETSESLTVNIDENEIIQVSEEHPEQSKNQGTISMIKGKQYPIEVVYSHGGQFEGYLKVEWSWAGREKTAIGPENLTHALKQEEYWGWQSKEIEFNPDDFVTIPVKNVIVVNEPGRFSAWPANNGVWIWGNEIVVGFEYCYYRYSKNGHSRDNDKPQLKYLARSIDGGETWTIRNPDNYVDDGDPVTVCKGDIDFTHSDFAARVNGNEFWVSYTRGKTWQGPYRIPDFGGKELSSRTHYRVNGPKDCLFFFSAKEPQVEAGLQDRAFCARTTDGGKTFNFLSWMTDNIEVRSVMPVTCRISENELISAMRRRHDARRKGLPDRGRNWIDVYRSNDNGQSWQFLSKVADTDRGKRNGNPPSMVRLADGRLCVAYGYRSEPYGIRAKISTDNGKTWGKEILLRKDGINWDIGYCRMVQRPDDKLVTLYYFSTEKNPEQHIAATIWNPGLVDKK